MTNSMPESRHLFTPFLRVAFALIALSAVLQGAALAGLFGPLEAPSFRLNIGVVEMALMAALCLNGLAIILRLVQLKAPARVERVAWMCWASLLLCTAGDWINRNFGLDYYQYDPVIEHSYLINSVFFFAPGYALFIAAAGVAAGHVQSKQQRALALSLTAFIGLVGFLPIANWAASAWALGITGFYAMVVTGMLAVAWWFFSLFGLSGWWLSLGAALASLADALIGQFWLYGHGNYPEIVHINWLIYFTSQALIQQFSWRYWETA